MSDTTPPAAAPAPPPIDPEAMLRSRNFPAIFLGAAGGIAASHLPGLSLTPAVAVGMGVMVVAFLKLSCRR